MKVESILGKRVVVKFIVNIEILVLV